MLVSRLGSVAFVNSGTASRLRVCIAKADQETPASTQGPRQEGRGMHVSYSGAVLADSNPVTRAVLASMLMALQQQDSMTFLLA